MKKSIPLLSTLALVVVFVGGISASDLMDSTSNMESGKIELDINAMIEKSRSEIESESITGNRETLNPQVVDDFEIPL